MGTGGKKEPKPDYRAVNTSIEGINTPSPIETKLTAMPNRFLDWMNRSGEFNNQPVDVTKAPGMENYLDLYGNANALAARKRVGDPTNAFAEGAHAGFAKQREQLGANERYNLRAAGLSGALQGLRSEALGLGGEAADRAFQRSQAYSNAMMQNQQNYYQRPQKKSPWETAIGIGLAGASAFI